MANNKIGPFDFVKNFQKGTNLFKSEEYSEAELRKAYVPFVINKALSYNIADIFYVDDLNFYHRLDPVLQHDYLINTIKAGRRGFTEWSKPDRSDDVLLVSEYYGYSLEKARQAMTVLSDEDIRTIREKMELGGQNGGSEG